MENCYGLATVHCYTVLRVSLTEFINPAFRPILSKRWDRLISNCITRHSSKMLVPMPLRRLLVTSHTHRLMCPERFLLSTRVHGTQLLRESSADDQNITVFELYAFPLRNLLELVCRDAVVAKAVVRFPLTFTPGSVVEQDTSGD